MQDATLKHADTFFIFTTVAVVIAIIILLVILYMCIRAVKIFRSISKKTERLLEKATDVAEDSLKGETPIKKSLPLILPLVAMLFKKTKKKKASDNS